jgi:F420-dependent methylenetetrahydromethanopterin dehydrogenase
MATRFSRVSGEYEISGQYRTKGKALRAYTIANKVADVKAKLKEEL